MDLYEKLNAEFMELKTKESKTLRRHEKQLRVIELAFKDLREEATEQVLESGLLEGEWELSAGHYSYPYKLVKQGEAPEVLQNLLASSCHVFKTNYGKLCRFDFGDGMLVEMNTRYIEGEPRLILEPKSSFYKVSVFAFISKCENYGIKISMKAMTQTLKVLRSQANYLQDEIDKWTLDALETSS